MAYCVPIFGPKLALSSPFLRTQRYCRVKRCRRYCRNSFLPYHFITLGFGGVDERPLRKAERKRRSWPGGGKMSGLTRDDTLEPVWRDQIRRHERGQGNITSSGQLIRNRSGIPYTIGSQSAECAPQQQLLRKVVRHTFDISQALCRTSAHGRSLAATVNPRNIAIDSTRPMY